ncbi:hypothetical protein OJAV_G00051540 [Oryzias javanicus]|uniref:SEA domain-containing protein n=1 Tax=Oryzias javanicus TaxID=123683 RepID=A0A437D8A9_ORYJA|nr:hypothetical protein OJAV_G00051540 [Oryzias javanicus]
MAAGFLIGRFLLIFVLSEIKYSSVFPSVGSRGSFQVTFDPGYHHHHHHHKPFNPLTKYLLRLKEGLLELPKLLHHKHDQPQCCDAQSGPSSVIGHPIITCTCLSSMSFVDFSVTSTPVPTATATPMTTMTTVLGTSTTADFTSTTMGLSSTTLTTVLDTTTTTTIIILTTRTRHPIMAVTL